MLKKTLEFFHSDPKAVFALSWILFAILLLPNILEKFRWHPAGGVTDRRQFSVLFLLIVLTILVGWPLWRVLQNEKLSSVRESVVVVIGFVPIQVLIFLAFAIAGELIQYTSYLEKGGYLVITGFAISSFIGGCWIGFKKTRMTWLWCLFGLLFFWAPLILDGIKWSTTDYIRALSWATCAVAGGYIGRGISLGETEKSPYTSAVQE
jgi:hypothetical protein